MPRRMRARLVATLAAIFAAAISGDVLAQSNSPQELQGLRPSENPPVGQMISKASECDLRQIPMVNTTPGAVAACTTVKNPAAGEPQSVQRGMKFFLSFNCVGCHAPMVPAVWDRRSATHRFSNTAPIRRCFFW